jgi:hypothetical protein
VDGRGIKREDVLSRVLFQSASNAAAYVCRSKIFEHTTLSSQSTSIARHNRSNWKLGAKFHGIVDSTINPRTTSN